MITMFPLYEHYVTCEFNVLEGIFGASVRMMQLTPINGKKCRHEMTLLAGIADIALIYPQVIYAAYANLLRTEKSTRRNTIGLGKISRTNLFTFLVL
jgi:hypothetical protein